MRRIDEAHKGYLHNRSLPLGQRVEKMNKLAQILQSDAKTYAEIITQEMGKPLKQALTEVEASVRGVQFCAQNAQKQLSPTPVNSEADASYVQYDPLGVIFQVVPFFFPLWITLNGAAYIVAGNSLLHKASHSTSRIGLAIQDLFKEAGFDNGEFTMIFASSDYTERIIADKRIKGVVFTGSTKGWAAYRIDCWKNTKKCVMELGRCDPFWS
eukprot:TRINITY_DN16772_c0_g1_i1.p1 TRINITY_DN16772_c0_g1~~TRINITY_DN16772_c0_g1_i1.p1  ORF type:complete len:212 (+),score=21.75 TRINITY_DN16772_c0_g1_i1:369-1004(+)